MSVLLSLPPRTALKRSFDEGPYSRSASPSPDDVSTGTVRHPLSRNFSSASLLSISSLPTGDAKWISENIYPAAASRSACNLASNRSIDFTTRSSPGPQLRKTDYGHYPSREPSPLQEVNLNLCYINQDNLTVDGDEGDDESLPERKFVNPFETLEEEQSVFEDIPLQSGSDLSLLTVSTAPQVPFKRWISTLRRKNLQRRAEVSSSAQRGHLDVMPSDLPTKTPTRRNGTQSGHRQSLSLSSSLGFVTAVKSASVTVASTSVARLSRRSHVRSANRSNFSEARQSMDSNTASLGLVMDKAACSRSEQRRSLLSELVVSEEGYIEDVRKLVNVYFTLLASMSSLPDPTRKSIKQALSAIQQLHESILRELHEIVPNIERTLAHLPMSPTPKPHHVRFHSLDLTPARNLALRLVRQRGRSLDFDRQSEHHLLAQAADSKTAAAVARVFEKHMKDFFAYAAYGAHHDAVRRDRDATFRAVPNWSSYERGIETLSRSLASLNNREACSNRALMLDDLLMKPLQRVMRYPLIFESLCKETPACDDPEAHAELEKVLFRLRETTAEIDRAQSDPRTTQLWEATWMLQDKLFFKHESMSQSVMSRLLGQVVLCGALHVAYQTKNGVKGQYMACILYGSYLVLATVDNGHEQFSVMAVITLANAAIHETDNGRGLQCHTALYTWKLAFESGHRLFEIIFSACSAEEEQGWREQTLFRIAAENKDVSEGRSGVHDMIASLSLDIKPIGTVFGLASRRRMSLDRAATLDGKALLSQVIIKNTQAQITQDEDQASYQLSTVARSKSEKTAGHIPLLAPRRAERIRLETLLRDMWTVDIIPWPGMSPRKSDQIRASASSVMRKLSMASLASNFSKRSASYTSLTSGHSQPKRRPRSALSASSKPSYIHNSIEKPRRRPPINFQTAPNDFLPEDFELPIPSKREVRRRRFSSRVIGSERPSPPKRPASALGGRLQWGNTPKAKDIEPAPKLQLALQGDGACDTESQSKASRTASDSSHDARPPASATPTKASALRPPAKKPKKVRSRLFKLFANFEITTS